ncbi:MAG: cell envelope integrity protein TolA [Proteobacteria bacterium]|nr:cell envelope integrity protein TolA [Pseudomonadota bacterium]
MRYSHPTLSVLRTPVLVSAALHAAMILFFAMVPALGFRFDERPTKIVWVELPKGTSEEIELSVKKTEGLPRSTIEEQKRLEPSQETLPALKPKDAKEAKLDIKTELPPRPKMEFEDKKVRKAEAPRPKMRADRKIQDALAKIDKQLRDRTVVPEAAQIEKEGQGFKYGTGKEPLRVMPSDPEYLKYQSMIRYKVMKEWIIPMIFAEDESASYNARVEVMINLDGDVTSIRWQSQSGNAAFDQSAVRAIKKASPFPKPPDRLAWEAYNEGFLIEFDPRLKAKY